MAGAAKNCLHCNDEIHFTGGYFYAGNTAAGGKGVKTDSTLVVDGGRLVINTSGTYGKDDKGGQESPKGMKADGDITINGGDITVRCIGKCEGSEGIESKKNLYINGGTNNVMAYDDAMNAAALVVISGGEIIGIGGTVYSPSTSSTQYVIVYNGCPMSTTQELAVKDESGTKILAVTSPQGSQSASVILSSSKFVKEGKYTISIGDTVYQTVTLSKKITTIGSQTGPGSGPGRFGPGY